MKRSSVLEARKFAVAFFAWMGFVAWSSLSTFPEDGTPSIDIPHFDKFVHFCFYFGAAVLGTLFLRETLKDSISKVKSLLYAVLGAILFGIGIEFLQHYFTLDRQGDAMDVLANSCGAIVGVLALKWFFSRGSRLNWN